jgi:hypothetical protein
VITRGKDGNVLPQDETGIAVIETEIVTVIVGEMAIGMTIVEIEKTIDGTIICAATGILKRTWKRMIQGDGEMTANGMRELLPDVSENIVNVYVKNLHERKAGNYPVTVGGPSWRNVMVAISEVLVATEGRVY